MAVIDRNARFVTWGLGLMFIVSGLMKSVNLPAFANTLHSFFGLLGFDFMYGMEMFTAFVVCAGEMALGLLAFNGATIGMTRWLYPVVMLFFTWVTYDNYTSVYGGIESCGCFGELVHLSPGDTFFKNLALLAVSLMAVVGRRPCCGVGFRQGMAVRHVAAVMLTAAVPPLCSVMLIDRLQPGHYLTMYIAVSAMAVAMCMIYSLLNFNKKAPSKGAAY